MQNHLTDDSLSARLRALLTAAPDPSQADIAQQVVVVERQLSDGYTNSNHLLRYGGQRAVLRLGNPAAARLGIDRQRELAIWRMAAACGISPHLLAFDSGDGDAVSAFVDAPSAADLLAAGHAFSIAQLAQLLQRVHALPVDQVGGLMADAGPMGNVERYVAMRDEYGLVWPDWLPALRAQLQRVHSTPVALTLTHHDFNPWNVLVRRDAPALMLDWEYAGLGDPLFDLVSAFVHWNMTEAQRHELLHAYGCEALGHGRIAALECLFHLREFTWAGAMLALGSGNPSVQEQWDRESAWLAHWNAQWQAHGQAVARTFY